MSRCRISADAILWPQSTIVIPSAVEESRAGTTRAGSGDPSTPLPCAQNDALSASLDVDLGAGRFDLLLDLFGFGLGHAFLDRLGRAIDKFLGFL